MKGLRGVITKLEGLFDTFNAEFYDGELEKPVITVSPDTSSSYGWVTTCKIWKEVGSEHGKYEINICAEYLNRPFKQVCATLLHEMVHLYCLQHDIKDTSRGTAYHNKRFKAEGEQRGLILEQDEKYGWTKTKLNEETEAFVDAMNEEGFTLYRSKIEKAKANKKKSSSRKYICPECGVIVRATKEVRILCGDCDVELELEES